MVVVVGGGMPFFVFGAYGVARGALAFCLPETLDLPLYDTMAGMEDGEKARDDERTRRTGLLGRAVNGPDVSRLGRPVAALCSLIGPGIYTHAACKQPRALASTCRWLADAAAAAHHLAHRASALWLLVGERGHVQVSVQGLPQHAFPPTSIHARATRMLPRAPEFARGPPLA
ncbi:Organic cation/carnitine transporter 4 [Apostasia shenzhenica]|uniref:Organic cation/carnitine transporter 4 n=1 Tax=Apostasia shenzhenica TaxID=1088818 RepID=A0A2I0BFH2_9ASPA|nr:Organic cation/carnitine transporter 4 [Apostasia shenzhenica]